MLFYLYLKVLNSLELVSKLLLAILFVRSNDKEIDNNDNNDYDA